jgi:hypothetical protein
MGNNPLNKLSQALSSSNIQNLQNMGQNMNIEAGNNTFLNLKEFKEHIKQNLKELNADLSISLERPFKLADIVRGDDNYDSDGYIEEDDSDRDKEDSILLTFSKGPEGGNFKSVENLRDIKEQINTKFNQSPAKSERSSFSNKNKQSGSNFFIIQTSEELSEILYGGARYNENKYNMTYEEKQVLNPNSSMVEGQMETIQILKAEQLLIILQYLYSELHSGLVELSDNFVEERRKYFSVDHTTYISLINYFLRKKEEFFLCVLSDIMSKLNISQKNLDNTFFYYMNVADPSDEVVHDIKSAYDKVYHAGIK